MAKRYRKKPVVVEAEQWFPGKEVPGVLFEHPAPGGAAAPVRAHVVTIHGQVAFLAPGDFVVTEPDGAHHYPCKPAIFAEFYDLIED